MTEKILPTPKPAPPPPAKGPPSASRRWIAGAFGAPLLLLVGIGAAWWSRGHGAASPRPGTGPRAVTSPSAGGLALRVEVARPRKGGLGRQVDQPGDVHAFNKAALYAKVSGYLVDQKVDIGDTVKKGDVLARIDVPEVFKAADQARAAVSQAVAKVKLAEARVHTTQADVKSAEAQLEQAEADLIRYTADRVYRKKEYDRIAGLVAQKAVEQQLADEKQEYYQAAVAAERTAQAAIATARAQIEGAKARLEQAEADVEAARADVEAARSALAKAEVFVGYTAIVSPYNGVITHRYFHNGDFIRAASEGGTTPVLAVAGTDLMRVVVLVPDLDVPFVKRGDPARLRVDALPGRVFNGKVSRFANSENEQKLMRTEVDLPNPDNLLRDGMYGTATLLLQPPADDLTIPSTALIEQDGEGNGAVFVVRDGKAHRVPVKVGLDNGKEVEIVQGLSPDAEVIVRYNGSLDEGVAVEPVPPSRAT